MVKAQWTVVSPHSGDLEEDAPTNFGGSGSGVDMNPTGMRKKKKKILDARTKEYREHKARLESRRQARQEKKVSKLSTSVKESIESFGREYLLAEGNMDILRSIVKRKSAKPVKFSDGKSMVDMFTASAIVQVYDKVNPDNQAKMKKMVNGKQSQFMAIQDLAMKASK